MCLIFGSRIIIPLEDSLQTSGDGRELILRVRKYALVPSTALSFKELQRERRRKPYITIEIRDLEDMEASMGDSYSSLKL